MRIISVRSVSALNFKKVKIHLGAEQFFAVLGAQSRRKAVVTMGTGRKVLFLTQGKIIYFPEPLSFSSITFPVFWDERFSKTGILFIQVGWALPDTLS